MSREFVLAHDTYDMMCLFTSTIAYCHAILPTARSRGVSGDVLATNMPHTLTIDLLEINIAEDLEKSLVLGLSR